MSEHFSLRHSLMRDPRISATAKMVAALCVGSAQHGATVAELTTHTLEAATPEGRAAIMAATAELERYGYITRGPQGELIIKDEPGQVTA